MGKKQKKNEQMQIPGYYFDTEKNRYFKIESNAFASTSSQRSRQEKQVLRDRLLATQELNPGSCSSSITHFSKLLHFRSINQSLTSFNRLASEILIKSVSRKVIFKTHRRETIYKSLFHDSSSRLMMISSGGGWYPRLNSIKKNQYGGFDHVIHESFLENLTPSSMCGTKEILAMTFLGSDNPLRVWNYQDETLMDFVFPGPLNNDIWTCSIDHDGNICLINGGYLYRTARISSYTARSSRLALRDELRSSDTLSMACFKQDLLLTGHRNGHIGFFDSRLKKEVAIIKEKSSIGYLKPISQSNSNHSEDYFLSSNMDSQINMYDIRRMDIVQTFPRHVNTHLRLKCDIWNNNTLISPGSDNFIRGWNLSSGALVWQKLLSPALNEAPCELSLSNSIENNGFFTCQSDEVSFWSIKDQLDQE